MANEQTTVPLFVAAEVLTAADMNLSAGTGVPVFSNSTTRDAGFGGAGEKVLAEGQLCYLSNTNVVQYYDGAAWATVGPSSTVGLVAIAPTSVAVGSGTATASANGQVTLTSVGTSVSLNGVFSASYTNYKVIYRTTSSAAASITVRLRVGGVDSSSSDYLKQSNIVEASANFPSTVAATTSWGLNGTVTLNNTAVFDLFNPFSAAVTFALGMFDQSTATTQTDFAVFSAMNKATTSYDGITILFNTGTANGTVSVYGYAI
jgi:hypothetical protein